MKTALEWYRELYQRSGGATEADIAAIQADALDGLRDRFAAAALTGLLAWGAYPASDYKTYAERAYNLADAMVARRATQQQTQHQQQE